VSLTSSSSLLRAYEPAAAIGSRRRFPAGQDPPCRIGAAASCLAGL